MKLSIAAFALLLVAGTLRAQTSAPAAPVAQGLPPLPDIDEKKPASSQTQERTVTGRGDDRRAAILNGLLTAVEQVNGTHLDPKSVTHRSYTDAVEDLKDSFKSSVVSNTDIKTASRGLIDSYEVQSETEDQQTKHISAQMIVRARVFDPNDPSLASRRKIIAVLPFRSAHAQYEIYDNKVPSADLLPLLSQGLVKGLVQSRKFTVLDREFLTEVMGEQKLMQAGNSPPEELQRIGKQLGADLLLVGSLDDADAAASTKTIQLTGKNVSSRGAKAAVSYRVLSVATGKIHWADSYRHTYSNDEFKTLSPERAGLRTEEMLMDDAGAVISDQIIEGVYPIRVVKIDGDQIILNQGGLRTGPGEEFDVFNQGELVFDPDTNEPLERIESPVARIRVVRVTNKMSYAQMVSGSAAKIVTAQAVCRRAAPAPLAEPAAAQ